MSELYGDMPQSALEALVKAEGEQARMAEKLAAAEARIAQAELTDKLRDIAAEVGVPTGALADFLNRGKAQLRMKNGRPAGEHGEFVNLVGWANDLRESAPHLFEASTAAPARTAAEAPKPGSVVSGNVKRAAFDAMSGKEKHVASLAFRAGTAKLVD